METNTLNTQYAGKNLIKVTTAADFAAGELTGLIPANVGSGALTLAEGALEGRFVSAAYLLQDFRTMTASWNASIPRGSTVETLARVWDAAANAWGEWQSWGEYGMAMLRHSMKDGITAPPDEFDRPEWEHGGTVKAQFSAILRRNDAQAPAPVLRQLTYSIKGTKEAPIPATYAEEAPASIPLKALTPAPAYAQGNRHPDIGHSICSPTTITVQLNGRDPGLDINHEALALSAGFDFGYGWGNWAFSTAAAGLYGYEAYTQYGDLNILLSELANGRSVGLSVRYNKDPESEYYLENAYNNTGGHLFTVIGYEYRDENGMPDEAKRPENLYFYSSDSYAPNDAASVHLYRWTHLDKCWPGRAMYIVSAKPVAGAAVTGVEEIAAALAPAGENAYALMAEGVKVDLTNFTEDKKAVSGRGIFAYTVEGLRTDAATPTFTETYKGVDYENRVWVTANDTFFYSGFATSEDGSILFDAANALYAAGIPEGETRALTIYAITNDGRMYCAPLTATSHKGDEKSAQ